ncbi:hypothetical protein [Micromonospora sp. WMMD980]|uniref:hypothetical protein n=1 Tax=Micromonospora sp. WMMD980 TaxID=3016088 RepID=UPI003242030D
MTANTTVATTIHRSQLLDEALPYADHDFNVDFAITPDEVVTCSPDRERPPGIMRERLRPDQLHDIPALR